MSTILSQPQYFKAWACNYIRSKVQVDYPSCPNIYNGFVKGGSYGMGD